MPFFNYEMSSSDQAALSAAMASDRRGEVHLEFPVECDGFACTAEVKLYAWSRDMERAPADEGDADLVPERDIEASASVELAVDGGGSALRVEIEAEDEWRWASGTLESHARSMLAQAINAAVEALAKTPAYKEMLGSKELAHEMRVIIDADQAAPPRRPRSL